MMLQGQQGSQNLYMIQKQHNQNLLRHHILSKNRGMDPGMYPGAGAIPPNSSQPGAMGHMMGQPQGEYRSSSSSFHQG